jgi:hypothetical protein
MNNNHQAREEIMQEFKHMAPESDTYRLAADLIDLAGRYLEAAEKWNDGSLKDIGIMLLDHGREVARDTIEYRDYLERKLNRETV